MRLWAFGADSWRKQRKRISGKRMIFYNLVKEKNHRLLLYSGCLDDSWNCWVLFCCCLCWSSCYCWRTPKKWLPLPYLIRLTAIVNKASRLMITLRRAILQFQSQPFVFIIVFFFVFQFYFFQEKTEKPTMQRITRKCVWSFCSGASQAATIVIVRFLYLYFIQIILIVCVCAWIYDMRSPSELKHHLPSRLASIKDEWK